MWTRHRCILQLLLASLLGGCDHTSYALIHGQVKFAGGRPGPADALVLIRFEQPFGFATVTNSEGKYVCPLTIFLGPSKDQRATVRVLDGSETQTVKWTKDGAAKASRIDVFVRDSTADLRPSVRDSLGQFYLPCD